MNHYRDDFDHKHGEDDRNANVFDDVMLTKARMLEKALSARSVNLYMTCGIN